MSAANGSSLHASHRRWRIAVLLGIGVLVNFFDRVNISVAQDALRQSWGITALTFGILASAYNWTYAVLQIPVGVMLDRWGVRRIGRVATFIWSMASFASGLAIGVYSFFAARLLLGIGEAPTFPANSKAVGYWFPESERSFATSINDAAAKFASAIGVPILGILLIRFGWRWSFEFTGAISLVYFFLFWKVYRNPSEDSRLSPAERQWMAEGKAQPESAPARHAHGAPLLYLARQRQVLGATIGFAAYNYVFYLVLVWLPSYLTMVQHVDLLHSSLDTSIPWLVATVTDLLIGGWMVDALVRRGARPWLVRQTVLVGGLALGGALYGASFAHSAGQAVVWISIAMAGLGAMAPVGWSVPSLIAPRESVGRIGGIMNFATQIAAISAPIVTGYFAGKDNFRAAFLIAAIVLAVGIAGYVVGLGKLRVIPEPA
ncbi:MAG TPA: MFS transporter [Acidobacteriaceae bacterium]|jgi:MFS family permease|nr:MFS transporter [Acidobacteriaceae bacterium]